LWNVFLETLTENTAKKMPKSKNLVKKIYYVKSGILSGSSHDQKKDSLCAKGGKKMSSPGQNPAKGKRPKKDKAGAFFRPVSSCQK